MAGLMKKQGDAWSGFGELLLHVSLFMLSGPALILLQKYVLDIVSFEYPIAIVMVGTVARWLLVLVLVGLHRTPGCQVARGCHQPVSTIRPTRVVASLPGVRIGCTDDTF
jgi:hypothetical protein